MRSITAFYAWQSDTPAHINRDFINIALRDAAQRISKDSSLDVTLLVDSDTQGIPGTPPVSATILKKIAHCELFVPDVTFVGKTEEGKQLPNPNVMIEYGYALRKHGHRAMLPVMNTVYGLPGDLPFDMRYLRHPITYCAEASLQDSERRKARELFSRKLESKLRLQISATQAPSPARVEFPKAKSNDPPARFRSPGQRIGVLWNSLPVYRLRANLDVFLAQGPAFWLRVMPAVDSTRRWTPLELQALANRITLLPMVEIIGDLDWLRESDGFGSCIITDRQSSETPSAVFVFDTGEIWSIDTVYLSFEANAIYLSEMENATTGAFVITRDSCLTSVSIRHIAGKLALPALKTDA